MNALNLLIETTGREGDEEEGRKERLYVEREREK